MTGSGRVACALLLASLGPLAASSAGHGLRLAQPASDERAPGPMSDAKIFPIGSAQAWPMVLKKLEELGLAAERTDRPNQVVITKWRDFGKKTAAWLKAPVLPAPYIAQNVRFEVFVSPFAEPARVYVGSILEARARDQTATAYNFPGPNQALMAEITKALGLQGHPLPQEVDLRKRLALSLIEGGADGCLSRAAAPKGGKLQEPRKIPASEFEVLYPGGELKERKAGTVRVGFTIREDGGVADVRLLDSPRGDPFETSALGAASLLLYAPTRIDECPVPTQVTYSVRYGQR